MNHTQFVEGWSQHQHLLKGFAMKLTNNYEDANDLLQETSLKAFKYRKQFIKGSNLKAWLSTIMRNTFINNLRTRKRRPTIQDGTDTNFYLNQGRDSITVNKGEANVLMDELHLLIDSIPKDYSVPFLLSYQGYKYEEIAKLLAAPLGTIKSRIFTARKLLKAAIEERYEAIGTADLLK
ncbi:MAG: RNA polymerase sigma factor [Bacteroidota bacterium]